MIFHVWRCGAILLAMRIGVITEFQGQGFGGKLLRVLIDKCDKFGIPIYLETEIEKHVKLYQKFGFNTIKQITLPIVNLPMWEMVREPGTLLRIEGH